MRFADRYAPATASGYRRPRGISGESATEAARRGGGARGAEISRNWLGLAGTIAAIALLLGACAMWWSRCFAAIIPGDGASAPTLVGSWASSCRCSRRSPAFAQLSGLLVLPWAAGCHRIDPPLRPPQFA